MCHWFRKPLPSTDSLENSHWPQNKDVSHAGRHLFVHLPRGRGGGMINHQTGKANFTHKPILPYMKCHLTLNIKSYHVSMDPSISFHFSKKGVQLLIYNTASPENPTCATVYNLFHMKTTNPILGSPHFCSRENSLLREKIFKFGILS